MAALNEETLPKWAQERLRDYRREIEHLREKLTTAAEGTEKAPFFFEFFDRARETPFYIPRFARLQHCNSDPVERRNVMEFQGDNEWVKVYAHDGTLHIEPVAANVVKIKVNRR